MEPPIQPSAQPPVLELNSISKSFDGVAALRRVSLRLKAGETLGLIGENGAGKSTLIKIVSGVLRPDEGQIRWRGEEVSFAQPHDAIRLGIGTIHQELACFNHLSVTENLMLGERWPRFWWGGVRWGRLHAEAQSRLDELGLRLNARRFFGQLSSAQKQEVAIARALLHRTKLLILDEPTASLSEPEVKRLFTRLAELRAQGAALLYVSHRLDEVVQLTDRVAVLRDGALAAEYPTRDAAVPRMVRDMVGRALPPARPRVRPADSGAVALELNHAGRRGMFHDVSLRLRAGEILGLAGLVGAGRSELARAIYGLYPLHTGEMRLAGRPWRPRSPRQAVAAGLVYIPEERKRQALVADHALRESISIGFSDRLTRFGMVRRGEEDARVRSALRTYAIRASGPDQRVGNLSGGNQQKAVLARWLDRDPNVLVLDEPTRGVDVGAKAEIHGLIDRLAAEGKAILLISSDLPEILFLSHRILVMCQGALAAELEGASMTQENVLWAASGLRDRAEPDGAPPPS